MYPWESQICRISTGRLNTVNDSVIGGQSGITGVSKFGGQLGKVLGFTPDQIGTMYDSAVGTLYGGRFRYVKMRAADDDSPALTPGKILFWDTTVTSWWTAYQVTRDENLSTSDNAVAIAGIYLGGIEPGNYGFIQDLGLVPVRMASVLTGSLVTGARVYAKGAGDLGLDQGTGDVLTTDSTSLANKRYLGWAPVAPVASALANVVLDFTNVLGVA